MKKTLGKMAPERCTEPVNLVKLGKAATGSACYSGGGVKAPIKVLAVRLR